MDKNGNKTSHTFAGVLRDMRQELVSMSTYISKLTNSKDNELSLKVKIENINDFTQSMQEAKGRIETFQDVLDQLDNNSVFLYSMSKLRISLLPYKFSPTILKN